MVTANLPGFAPSYDGAAELFFVNVKHRGIRRHIIHDLFQRLKRHWRTGIAQVFTFTLTYYLDDRLVGRGIYQLTLKIEVGIHGPVACRHLRARHNQRYRDHLIELQPFFAGIHARNRPAENQTARPRRRDQRFALFNC